MESIDHLELTAFSELDRRSLPGDGGFVALYWNPKTNELMIFVSTPDDWFTFRPKDGAEAKEMFHHPFAYSGEIDRQRDEKLRAELETLETDAIVALEEKQEKEDAA